MSPGDYLSKGDGTCKITFHDSLIVSERTTQRKRFLFFTECRKSLSISRKLIDRFVSAMLRNRAATFVKATCEFELRDWHSWCESTLLEERLRGPSEPHPRLASRVGTFSIGSFEVIVFVHSLQHCLTTRFCIFFVACFKSISMESNSLKSKLLTQVDRGLYPVNSLKRALTGDPLRNSSPRVAQIPGAQPLRLRS